MKRPPVDKKRPGGLGSSGGPPAVVTIVPVASNARTAFKGLGYDNDLAALKDNFARQLLGQRDYPGISEEKWVKLFGTLKGNTSCLHIELKNITLGFAACKQLGTDITLLIL